MGCDTVVVSDCVASGDTLACADIRLPALVGEKSGMVTNSERWRGSGLRAGTG